MKKIGNIFHRGVALLCLVVLIGPLVFPSQREGGSFTLILMSYGCQVYKDIFEFIILGIFFYAVWLFERNKLNSITWQDGWKHFFGLDDGKEVKTSTTLGILSFFISVTFALVTFSSTSNIWDHCGR